MKPMKPDRTESRVFIAGLRSFEIVYLPQTGQIVSRFPPARRAQEHEEVKSAMGPRTGTDGSARLN